MSFSKLSIGKKLALSFIVLILVMLVTNTLNITSISTIRSQWEKTQVTEQMQMIVAEREMDHLRWVMELQEYLISGATQAMELELDPTKCNLGRWLASEDFDNLIAEYPEFTSELEKIHKPHQELHASAHTIEGLLLERNAAAAELVYYDYTEPSLNQTIAILERVRSELDEKVNLIGEQMHQEISRSLVQTSVLLGVALVLSAVVAFLITRNITTPLSILKAATHRIGSGDLGVEWEIKSGDEVGELSIAIEGMLDGLRSLVRGIQATSEGVNLLSQDLSSMAVQTGAAITEVASTSNEFASSSISMAENSESMRLNTEHAVSELERGLDMLRVAVKDVASARGDVQNLTHSVDNLAEQSKQIGAIVDLITQISDQTNLLALNAAIEAARAGDSGRGFAVVADEVRRLAEQSGQASGDIAELIQNILRDTNETISRMEQADGSVERVDEQIDLTGNTFVAISKVFQEVAAQVIEIARAAEDVGAGSEEIAASTEEQSAIANALAGDAEKLADLAKELQAQISSFSGF